MIRHCEGIVAAAALAVTTRPPRDRESVQLLQMDRPRLQDTVFSELCRRGPRTGPTIIEIFRLCVSRWLTTSERCSAARNGPVTTLVDHAVPRALLAALVIAPGFFGGRSRNERATPHLQYDDHKRDAYNRSCRDQFLACVHLERFGERPIRPLSCASVRLTGRDRSLRSHATGAYRDVSRAAQLSATWGTASKASARPSRVDGLPYSSRQRLCRPPRPGH
jgi:hypothetical protein